MWAPAMLQALKMSEGFTELWPTRLLTRQLPGAAPANEALKEVLLQLEAGHTHSEKQAVFNDSSNEKTDLTTDYLQQELLSVDHPAIHWLASCINKTVADYLRNCGVDVDVSWQLQAWANINRLGDYHNLHNHPHSYLSGTYYVQLPKASEQQAGSRSDLDSCAISFYDPRGQANMTAIKGDGQIDPEHRVQPVPGQILLWPSFLHHFVHPNLSSELRISVSFNVVLKMTKELLPA